jgi:putative colanic acid biosynthesis acetyltransferase WcaB
VQREGYPKIGNNVDIGANSVILGNIEIGTNSIIGAGSIVVKSIPENCVAVGNPAKVIKKLDGSVRV